MPSTNPITNNPLDPFKTNTPTGSNLQLDTLPKLAEEVDSLGFKAGIASYDAKMGEWLQKFQNDLNEQLRAPAPVQGSTVT